EALHRVDGQRARLLLPADLEVAAVERVLDVAEGAHGKGEVGLLVLPDLLVHVLGGRLDAVDGQLVELLVAALRRRVRRLHRLRRQRRRVLRRLLLADCHAYAFLLRSRMSSRSVTVLSRCPSESPRISCRPIATCGMYFSM